MTEKELFEKNLEISSEFSRYIIAHPDVAEKIPRDAEVIFLVESDPELSRHNLELGRKLKEGGLTVVLVRIKGIRAVEESRLIEPHLEFAA
jgi:hypothetical protein